jgi:hypothetical protein
VKHGLYATIRYEAKLELDADQQVVMPSERVALLGQRQVEPEPQQRTLFPSVHTAPRTVMLPPRLGTGQRRVVTKSSKGVAAYASEIESKAGKGWIPSFNIGTKRSALANLPEDESRFPVTTWLKRMLAEGIQTLVLNSAKIRQPSPPGLGRSFRTDGSNLPWVIDRLREDPERYRCWLTHLQTAYDDIIDVDTVEKEDTKHRYITVHYRSNVTVPSWLVSDGTLRLLALTLPAYLPDAQGVYLIEEPENGIHPRALQTMFDSLSSVYKAQVLLATHSPVVVGLSSLEDVLCFAKTADGATDIVAGPNHPGLSKWKGSTNLGELFASGVLG